ncbi:MAG: GntR family transcriptional regulator [Eubacteriales bacterium]
MLFINKFSPTPIYLQVIDQFEELIFTGVIGAEEALPSVRALAKELGVNPNTLQRAYGEMENRNLCVSVPGSGRYVTKDAKKIIMKQKKESINEIADIVRNAKQSGVKLDDIVDLVKRVYKETSG